MIALLPTSQKAFVESAG